MATGSGDGLAAKASQKGVDMRGKIPEGRGVARLRARRGWSVEPVQNGGPYRVIRGRIDRPPDHSVGERVDASVEAAADRREAGSGDLDEGNANPSPVLGTTNTGAER